MAAEAAHLLEALPLPADRAAGEKDGQDLLLYSGRPPEQVRMSTRVEKPLILTHRPIISAAAAAALVQSGEIAPRPEREMAAVDLLPVSPVRRSFMAAVAVVVVTMAVLVIPPLAPADPAAAVTGLLFPGRRVPTARPIRAAAAAAAREITAPAAPAVRVWSLSVFQRL